VPGIAWPPPEVVKLPLLPALAGIVGCGFLLVVFAFNLLR
jgi:hypothetical protein